MDDDALFGHARDGNLIKLGQLVKQADLSATDGDGMTALMHAAAHGHYKVSGLLVGTDASNINAAYDAGKTALMHAAAAGSQRIVKLLLQKGADPSITDNDGRTAADHAAANGDTRTLNRLRASS